MTQLELPRIRNADPKNECWCIWRPGQKIHHCMYPWLLNPTCHCRYWVGSRKGRQLCTAWLDKRKVTCQHCRKSPHWYHGDPWAMYLPADWQPFRDPIKGLVLADYLDERGESTLADSLRSVCNRGAR